MKTVLLLLFLSSIFLFSGFVLSKPSSSNESQRENQSAKTQPSEPLPEAPKEEKQSFSPKNRTPSMSSDPKIENPPIENSSPGKNTETKPSPLVAAIKNDQLCELLSQLDDENIINENHISEFLELMGASEELQKLFAKDGPIYGNSDLNLGKTVAEKFVFALRLSGMVSIQAPKSQDDKRARKILLDLEKEEPGNAAFPFFRFAIEQRNPDWKEESEKTLQSLKEKSYFQSYLFSLVQDLHSQKWRSATYHFSLSQFLDYARIPYYIPGQAIMEYDRKNKTEFGKIVGDLMMQEGKQARRAHELGGFCSSQYEWGKNVSRSEEISSSQLSRKIEGWEENFSFPYPPYIDRYRCSSETYENYVRDAGKNF